MRLGVILIAAAAVLAVPSGCGGSGGDGPTTVTRPPQPPDPLTAAERATLKRMEGRVQSYCQRVARAAAGESPAPTEAQLNHVISTIDEVGELARRKPTASLPAGGDVRLALGDVAENLEGSNCSPSLVEHIDLLLASLPRGSP